MCFSVMVSAGLGWYLHNKKLFQLCDVLRQLGKLSEVQFESEPN